MINDELPIRVDELGGLLQTAGVRHILRETGEPTFRDDCDDYK